MGMMQVAGGGCHDASGIAFTGSGKTLVPGALVRSRIPGHVAEFWPSKPSTSWESKMTSTGNMNVESIHLWVLECGEKIPKNLSMNRNMHMKFRQNYVYSNNRNFQANTLQPFRLP